MPTVKTERVSSFHQTLSFSLDDLNLFDPKLSFKASISDTILKGRWQLEIDATTQTAPSLNIVVGYDAPHSSFGSNIKATSSLSWIGADGSRNKINTATWNLARTVPDPKSPGGYRWEILRSEIEAVAARSGGKFKLETHRKYLYEFKLRSASSPDTEVLAQLHSSFYSSPLPNDVRFFFLQPGGGAGLELWTRFSALPLELRALLTRSAPQAAPIVGRTTRNSASAPIAIPHYSLELDDDFENDSDDEADQVLAASSTLASAQAINLPTPSSFRQIDVKGLRYSTLKALLIYLDTGHIRFSPFKSFFSSSLPPTTRRSFLEKSLKDDPRLPLPVSPISNAAEELFSPLSLAHEEVQAVIIDFVGKNWAAIRDGESYKAIVAKIKRDEIKGAGKVLVDLIMAVQSK
ncbi:hypothetical protein JCM3765_007903 [Sporobolomyces pararoseus]